MSTTPEVFDALVLTQISPFSVRFELTKSIKKSTKAGGLYEKKVIVVENAKLNQSLSVEVTRQQYERLRVLNYTGINVFSASEGVENIAGYRQIILSGAALFHEGTSK
jgi:hypothetical protein